MAAHRIRLRGPWELEWIAAGLDRSGTSEKGNESKRIHLPAPWSEIFGGRTGRTRLARRFHQPTNLEPDEEVLLVFENMPGPWTVNLNGRQLTTSEDRRAVITRLLKPINILTIELDVDATSALDSENVAWGDVALEIGGA